MIYCAFILSLLSLLCNPFLWLFRCSLAATPLALVEAAPPLPDLPASIEIVFGANDAAAIVAALRAALPTARFLKFDVPPPPAPPPARPTHAALHAQRRRRHRRARRHGRPVDLPLPPAPRTPAAAVERGATLADQRAKFFRFRYFSLYSS